MKTINFSHPTSFPTCVSQTETVTHRELQYCNTELGNRFTNYPDGKIPREKHYGGKKLMESLITSTSSTSNNIFSPITVYPPPPICSN